MTTRRLNIGGVQQSSGWEILNIALGPGVDHAGDAKDLSRFPDETFMEIYSSHTLEHLDYVKEIDAALKEWLRVLVPGGRLTLSVPDPDLDVLSRLLSSGGLDLKDRFFVMRMMFGGHTNPHDYHLSGLDEGILSAFLLDAGYERLRRVERFGIFNDTSSMLFKGAPVSLNMIAFKPEKTEALQS